MGGSLAKWGSFIRQLRVGGALLGWGRGPRGHQLSSHVCQRTRRVWPNGPREARARGDRELSGGFGATTHRTSRRLAPRPTGRRGPAWPSLSVTQATVGHRPGEARLGVGRRSEALQRGGYLHFHTLRLCW